MEEVQCSENSSDNINDDDLDYLVNSDSSTCDLALVFQSHTFIVHQSVLANRSDFVKSWIRFPGSIESSDHDLPQLQIDIGQVLVPFGNEHHHEIDENDFRNYLRMAYGVWLPRSQPLLALKIAPIAVFMQSDHVRELCDLELAEAPDSWSKRLYYTAFNFASRWSLPKLAAALCTYIKDHVPLDALLARLLSSTAEHFLAMLSGLDLDPIVQIQTLVRYVTRNPLGSDLNDGLLVQDDMIEVLCRGYRNLCGRWTRSGITLEVLRLTRCMEFINVEAGHQVRLCILDILETQLLAGPLAYRDDHCWTES